MLCYSICVNYIVRPYMFSSISKGILAPKVSFRPPYSKNKCLLAVSCFLNPFLICTLSICYQCFCVSRMSSEITFISICYSSPKYIRVRSEREKGFMTLSRAILQDQAMRVHVRVRTKKLLNTNIN